MPSDICIFKRVENKYLLDGNTYARFFSQIRDKLIPDSYGKSTVCNLYLDTPNHRIIRASIDAHTYKEKLRLRSYGPPQVGSTVFLEIKKKFDGVVYKRRIAMTLGEAKEYLAFAKKPADTQIMREIDQAMKFYGWPAPRISLSYEREAFYSAASPDLRLTFDTGIRYRETEVSLEAGTAGKPLIRSGEHLLEIKTEGAMPLWLSRALDENGIFPTSFSKYGTAYLTGLAETKSSAEKGDFIYA